jgi:hypothetical protein
MILQIIKSFPMPTGKKQIVIVQFFVVMVSVLFMFACSGGREQHNVLSD